MHQNKNIAVSREKKMLRDYLKMTAEKKAPGIRTTFCPPFCN